jgi:hypothetical protein
MLRELLRRGWADGRPLMAVGVAGAAASAYFMLQEDAHLARVSEIRDDMTITKQKEKFSNVITKDPVLYEAKVKVALGDTFDGPIALRELSKGENVSVLRENVGPESKYHRCRSYAENSEPKMEGIYPSKLLEKVGK